MEELGNSQIRTYLSTGWSSKAVSSRTIVADKGYLVSTYSKLVRCVARLSFHNRDHVLLFRGQSKLYHTTGDNISIQPSIFRGYPKSDWSDTLYRRYELLNHAEELLVEAWESEGLAEFSRVSRQKILRWAILQHYEVCATPLLDVSQSLRVATSFASLEKSGDTAIVHVLAVPQLSGGISASAEAGLQIVRLNSICPPSALRPHFQEGYLIGEYPELQTFSQKRKYKLFEVDCARRLLATFQLDLSKGFWKDKDFPPISRKALYPDTRQRDKLARMTAGIKARLGTQNR